MGQSSSAPSAPALCHLGPLLALLIKNGDRAIPAILISATSEVARFHLLLRGGCSQHLLPRAPISINYFFVSRSVSVFFAESPIAGPQNIPRATSQTGQWKTEIPTRRTANVRTHRATRSTSFFISASPNLYYPFAALQMVDPILLAKGRRAPAINPNAAPRKKAAETPDRLAPLSFEQQLRDYPESSDTETTELAATNTFERSCKMGTITNLQTCGTFQFLTDEDTGMARRHLRACP